MAGEIFSVSTSSLDLVIVNELLTALPSSTVDFSLATYVSGTFQGVGSGLTGISASYIPPTYTASLANTASYISVANLPTASWATNALSSSYFSGSITGLVPSASYATSASYAPGGQGTTLITGSFYPITSSWSLSSSFVSSSNVVGFIQSASYCLSGSYFSYIDVNIQQLFTTQSLFSSQSVYSTQSVYAYSASWVSASVKITNADTASYILASNLPAHTASWSNFSLISINSNYASSSNVAVSAVNASSSLVSLSAIFASSSLYSTSSLSSSWASSSLSSSYILASNLPAHTASWANFALISINSNYASSSNVSVSTVNASSSIVSLSSNIASSSLYASSSNVAVNAINASSSVVALSSNTASSSLFSNSSLSSSWASSSLSASYILTSNLPAHTASWANFALVSINSNYASSSNVSVISNYASSSNVATNAVFASSSVAATSAVNASSSITTTFAVFASSSLYATSSLSASYASSSLSASYAPSGTPTFTGKTTYNVPVWISNTLSDTSSLSVYGERISINGTSSTAEVLFVRGTSSVSPNFIAEFTHNTNTYAQIKIENTNAGNSASADVIVEGDKATESYGYIDLGINSSGYGEPEFGLAGSLDGYLYTIGSGSVGGDLVIGSLSDSSIIFHTSGSHPDDERFRINRTAITSSVPIKGTTFLGTASYVTSKFTRGGTLYNSSGITSGANLIVWECPISCSVTNVKGYRVGGTTATINARKNGASNHLASDATIGSADTWVDGGAVQNTGYGPGDKLEIMIVTVGGSPTQVAVQVNYIK
jgi:hypothetical protein